MNTPEVSKINLIEMAEKANKDDVIAAVTLSQLHVYGGQQVTVDPLQALNWAKLGAESNHWLGMANLGYLLRHFYIGAAPDESRSLISRSLPGLSRAADKRDSHAQVLLGLILMAGFDRTIIEAATRLFATDAEKRAEENRKKRIFRLFNAAAAKNQPLAEFMLSMCHAYGMGVTENDGQAFHWAEKAAQHGHAQAQHLLSRYYANGTGVEENPAKAEEWCLAAAEQGYSDAMYRYGDLYYLKGDYQNAYSWYQKSAKKGNAEGGLKAAVILGKHEVDIPGRKAGRHIVSAFCRIKELLTRNQKEMAYRQLDQTSKENAERMLANIREAASIFTAPNGTKWMYWGPNELSEETLMVREISRPRP